MFLPCLVSGRSSLHVLVVWAKQGDRRPPYAGSLVRGLTAYASFIRSAPTIVLGDFNSNPCFGDSHSEWFRLLDDLGLVSAYHLHTAEAPGRERRSTYFHRATGGEPYHIDYCFIPKDWSSRLIRVAVGRKNTWSTLSDHVPLIVDLNLP
jgi:endonuclease/exonuclease/phosphatase family metal-dependent hydrolase